MLPAGDKACHQQGQPISIGCSETSVRNYHYSLRNDPKERSCHLLRGVSLKSRKPFVTHYGNKRALAKYVKGDRVTVLGQPPTGQQ